MVGAELEIRRVQGNKARPGGSGGAGALDLEHLDRATFGDPALRRDVLALFDRQAGQLLAEIAAAAEPAARGEIAHRLRGAALGIGAQAVAEAAAALERSPEDAGLLARLNLCVAAARVEVAALLAPH